MHVTLLRMLVSAGCGVAFAVVPSVTAAPASACPIGHFSDPYSNQCTVVGGIPTINGVPCIPGKHLGTCYGFVQNKPIPGANLP